MLRGALRSSSQLWLLFYSAAMGLDWEGFWYLANIGQALGILVLAVVLLWKRPLWVLPLPVLSLILMLSFEAVDPSTKITECTQTELSAARNCRRLPARPRWTSSPKPSNGCIARFNSTLSGVALI